MANDNASIPTQRISLKHLRLRPGQAIQTQSPEAGAPKEEAQFLAAIENKGVMVGPYRSGMKNTLEPDAFYFISGFTGQYDFSFISQVIQVFEQPFSYALMAYPQIVEARLVRRALRMKTSHPATITLPGLNESIAVTLVDVSHCGALVCSPQTLGVVGNNVNLSLSMQFEGEPVTLLIPSAICHSNKTVHEDSVNVGLSFKPVSNNDKLLLYFLEQTTNE